MLRRRDIFGIPLTIAGIGVAAYLTYVHYNQDALICGIGDCEVVQASSYSELFGIPIAILGLLMFCTLLGLMLLRMVRPASAEMATAGIVALLLGATIYFAYLTYLEIWVIEAICQWCVASAIITVLLLLFEGGLMIADYRRTSSELDMEAM